MLDQLCIVMIQTSHPGNIGSAARAMKTMGVSDLRLVCVFTPALTGNETHDIDGSYPIL